VQQYLAAGLVDEFELYVVPLMLGAENGSSKTSDCRAGPRTLIATFIRTRRTPQEEQPTHGLRLTL
jgi:riboflavin biosynthesis pyrimidine reductase